MTQLEVDPKSEQHNASNITFIHDGNGDFSRGMGMLVENMTSALVVAECKLLQGERL